MSDAGGKRRKARREIRFEAHHGEAIIIIRSRQASRHPYVMRKDACTKGHPNPIYRHNTHGGVEGAMLMPVLPRSAVEMPKSAGLPLLASPSPGLLPPGLEARFGGGHEKQHSRTRVHVRSYNAGTFSPELGSAVSLRLPLEHEAWALGNPSLTTHDPIIIVILSPSPPPPQPTCTPHRATTIYCHLGPHHLLASCRPPPVVPLDVLPTHKHQAKPNPQPLPNGTPSRAPSPTNCGPSPLPPAMTSTTSSIPPVKYSCFSTPKPTTSFDLPPL